MDLMDEGVQYGELLCSGDAGRGTAFRCPADSAADLRRAPREECVEIADTAAQYSRLKLQLKQSQTFSFLSSRTSAPNVSFQRLFTSSAWAGGLIPRVKP